MSSLAGPVPASPRFVLPDDLSATAPPEARGLRRDQVQLLVARAATVPAAPARIERTTFAALPGHLAPGDTVVINVSATVAAALDGVRRSSPTSSDDPVVIHLAGPHPDEDGTVVVEPRRRDGTGPLDDAHRGELVRLESDVTLRLIAPYPDPASGARRRLWRARLEGIEVPTELEGFLRRHGRPITYSYLEGRWPLTAYQTVYGQVPGSAEMASAGRPFTPELITALVARGVTVAPVVLHTGVSSLEAGERPPAERFEVPPHTARVVETTRRHGGRVIAVGTTVVRALETVAAPDGRIWPGAGWTDLELGPRRHARVVDGLLTGWHAPDASHLRLLDAVVGAPLVDAAYAAALDAGLLWHEFGDSCLLLP